MSDRPVLEISVDADAVVARLGALAGERLVRALGEGLGAGAHDAGTAVQQAVLGAGLLGPTGNLGQSTGAWPEPNGDALTWLVGVPETSPAARYAYLITDAEKTIVPQGHPYLAIPIGANRTGAGAAKYGSPRDVGELVFVRSKGRAGTAGLTAGLMVGDDYTPLFALVPSVTVKGRNVLEPTLQAQVPAIAATVQEHVDAAVGEAA